jgi:5-deoxy-5-amino-3-dehydroquinate synthase
VTAGLTTVRVPLAERGYDVVVGRGALCRLPSMLPPGARRALVVTQPGVGVAVETGIEQVVVEIGAGEESKTMRTVEALGRAMAQAGITRSDVVVAVGGGLVTDVAGFAAACWHRGTPVVHVATTLLAQVDAAIGGKTGVNLPEGKNLLGAFWQPLGVICDTATLDTLPAPEWRSGFGEVAKYAFIGAAGLASLPIEEQVAACVAVKARVVAADERDSGARLVLNYGHTLAHALEAAGLAAASGDLPGAGPPVLRHGEAVAIGLVFAARLAGALGRIGPERIVEHEEVVRSYGLPGSLPAGAEAASLIELMRRDKKAVGDLTFVLDGPNGVEPVRDVPAELVEQVLAEMPRAASTDEGEA